MIAVTIFTPTYNRGYILDRLYSSIQYQTVHNFEWIIVDDGSTDNTEELVRGWIRENNSFPIIYHRQVNSGKCRAINKGLELARGKLFLVVDSDDFLTKNALERVTKWEKDLPEDGRYCGVSGNLGSSDIETANRLFKGGFFDGTLLDRYHIVNGERAFAFYTRIHRQYKYPVFENEKFMTEAVVYNRMAHDGYRMRFYNDILCVYKYLEDGLTKAGNVLFLQNPRGYGLWLREKEEFIHNSFSSQFRLWYSFFCEMSFCEESYRLTKRKIAEYIGAPLPVIYVIAMLHRLRQILR